VTRQRRLDNLTTNDLRRLLVEKQRAERMGRMEQFRKTGRVTLADRNRVPRKFFKQLPERSETEPLQPAKKKKPRPLVDRILLAVEIAAVLGLVFVLLNGFFALRNLNTEAASAMQQPTMTATALIQAVVLPGGHIPPVNNGEVKFNEAEIPEHLRPIVQAMASLPLSTPGPEQAIRIQIPAIEVDAPVVQGDGLEQLKKGVGQHTGSANPGKNGNLVLSAHNDVFGEIFRNLDRLKTGDEVVVFSNQHKFVYVVRQVDIVEPTRVDVMDQTKEASLTLISCYPYMVDNKRIVVSAAFQE
jgi:sortase A